MVMKYSVVILLLLSGLSLSLKAQQDTALIGTITVKKKGQKKTLYDQLNDKLVLIDQQGKAVDASQVLSFDMAIAVKDSITTFSTTGAFLSHEMKEQLLAAKDGTIIYFKNIKAKNKKDEIESYPSTVIKAEDRMKRHSIIIQPGR